MRAYRSKSGKDTGVTGYFAGTDYIKVKFEGGEVYTYTYASAGKDQVEQMKLLAMQQRGLSTYISRYQPPYQ